MKVHLLQTGTTDLTYSYFYGGLETTSGVMGYLKFATDARRIRVPIHAYLIEHPTAGPILVDCGISREQARDHRNYYKGSILRYVMPADQYRLPEEQEIPAHLQRLGYRPEDIRTVVLTHLHEDHVGTLKLFPQARVIVTQSEWESRNSKALGVVPVYYHPSFMGHRHWEPVAFTSGPCHSFPVSQDLLGDGSLILLPTPGHTVGHASLLVRMDGYHLLLTGDVLYTLRHLDADAVRGVTMGRTESWVDSIQRIHGLRSALGDVVVVPGHDHTPYMAQLHAFLADGQLSPDERQAVQRYEATLFDGQGRLRSAAAPNFITPPPGAKVGTVA